MLFDNLLIASTCLLNVLADDFFTFVVKIKRTNGYTCVDQQKTMIEQGDVFSLTPCFLSV